VLVFEIVREKGKPVSREKAQSSRLVVTRAVMFPL
jgi:hypothetical protein